MCLAVRDISFRLSCLSFVSVFSSPTITGSEMEQRSRVSLPFCETIEFIRAQIALTEVFLSGTDKSVRCKDCKVWLSFNVSSYRTETSFFD